MGTSWKALSSRQLGANGQIYCAVNFPPEWKYHIPFSCSSIFFGEIWQEVMKFSFRTCFGSSPFLLHYIHLRSDSFGKKLATNYDASIAFHCWANHCSSLYSLATSVKAIHAKLSVCKINFHLPQMKILNALHLQRRGFVAPSTLDFLSFSTRHLGSVHKTQHSGINS